MGADTSIPSLAPSARRIRVIIADPYPVILRGVRKMMGQVLRNRVVAEASIMLSFGKKVISKEPEVALVDWSMAATPEFM